MSIVLDKKSAVSTFKALKKAVGKVSKERPILGNTLLTVADGRGVWTSTDLETSVRIVAGQVDSAMGPILVPIEPAIAATKSGATITIQSDGDKVNISTGLATSSYTAAHAADYPTIDMDAESWVDLDGQVMAEVLERAVIHAAKEAARYAIRGVFFGGKEGIRAVATDGKRLYKSRILSDVTGVNAIVPVATCNLILASLKNVSTVKMGWGFTNKGFTAREFSRVVFKLGVDVEISARCIEEQFPAYDSVIPSYTDETGFRANADAVRSAIVAVSSVGRDGPISIKLTSDGALRFKPENAAAPVTAHIDGVSTGAWADVHFNPDYMEDLFEHARGNVLLDMGKDGENPGTVAGPVAIRQDGDTWVLMPVSDSAKR